MVRFASTSSNMSAPKSDQTQAHLAVPILLVCWLCMRAYWWTSAKADARFVGVADEAFVKVLLWLPICVFVAWVMRRDSSAWTELGLDRGARSGLRFGLLATTPMLLAVFFLPSSVDADTLIGTALIGPFVEELLFRGFLFRQLVRRAGWSVPTAIAVSAIFFGFGHVPFADSDIWIALRGPLYISPRIVTDFSVALQYAVGGALFAWIASRWNSLWPAIALHGLINFWWALTPGEHARLVFEPSLLGAAQTLSIIVAIAMTLRFSREQRPQVTTMLDGPVGSRIGAENPT